MPASIDTRYLERRPAKDGRWYCVRDVPRDLRSTLGKRLVRALGTDDLREARRLRHAVLADFERQFADARRGGGGKLMDEAATYGNTMRRLHAGDGSAFSVGGPDGEETIPHKIEELGLLIHDRLDTIPDPAEAERFSGIARGIATPMLQHVDAWLRHGNRKRPPAPSTVQNYRASVSYLADALARHGAASIEAVTRTLAGRVVQEMLDRGDNPGTIHNRIAAMSSYWRWLQRRGIARDDVRNVWHDHGVAQNAEPGRRPLTDRELVALLNGPADAERHDVMHILALSGLRVHEVFNLRVADCVGGVFDVRASKTQAGVRRVPIHSGLAAIVARRTAAKPPDGFLIEEAGGASVRRSGAFVKDFGRYRQACGVHEATEGRQSAVTLHSVRSWFASTLRATQDTAVAATLLGHRKTGITDSAYTRFPLERLRQAVESVRLPVG